uniref:Uncharacterized protein n=1 Tax=Opuntia streptacantha TaxID=393608 RepID=A0A7C8ZID3_OPUST
MKPPHLWRPFYVQNVVGQNGLCGNHRQLFHHPHHLPTSNLHTRLPLTSSGGQLRLEGSLNLTLMGPSPQLAQQQGLFFATGKEGSSWLAHDLWRMLQFLLRKPRQCEMVSAPP